MIKGFHHAAISTPDLEQCVRFYTEVIGGKVAWTFGWPAGSPPPLPPDPSPLLSFSGVLDSAMIIDDL